MEMFATPHALWSRVRPPRVTAIETLGNPRGRMSAFTTESIRAANTSAVGGVVPAGSWAAAARSGVDDHVLHSARSASVGCTRSARTVGTTQASRHTPTIRIAYPI